MSSSSTSSSTTTSSTTISTIHNHIQILTNSKLVRQTFCPLFTELLLNVTYDTNQTLPIYVRFTVNPNIIEIIDQQTAKVEYTIYITNIELEKLVSSISDNILSPDELLEIWKVLFTQVTKQVLDNPIVNTSILFKMSSYVNKCIQVNLIDSNKNIVVSHTLTYMNNNWNIEPGVTNLNKIERIWNMTYTDCIEYQSALVDVIRSNTNIGWYNIGGRVAWLKFVAVYMSMRQRISVPPPNQP
jgi:hypothetical protein